MFARARAVVEFTGAHERPGHVLRVPMEADFGSDRERTAAADSTGAGAVARDSANTVRRLDADESRALLARTPLHVVQRALRRLLRRQP